MRRLKLVGLSADIRQVVFVDDAGSEFAAPADDRLRAALRGDRARLGQLEIEMESALRPRDIQARIRSGESPDAVAALAQVSVEKVMPYCVPVLAERQHIADLAGRSHVRRKNADSPARRLAEVVAEKLRGRGIEPDAAEWDAWRREDGRWTVQAAYLSGEHERAAQFVFDAVGRFSLADDDEARWLTGERQSTSKGPQPREPGTRTGERRLSSVPASDDLLSLSSPGSQSSPAGDDDQSDDLTAVVRAVSETDDAAAGAARGMDVGDEADAELQDTAVASDTCGDAEDDGQDRSESPAAEIASPVAMPASEPVTEPTPERRRRTGRRASVPSWDEIMFGRSKDE